METRMLSLTEEQKAIRQMVRNFVDDRVRPWIRENRDREWTAPAAELWPEEMVREADKLGLRTINVPEKYGGASYNAVTWAVIGEELARGDIGLLATLCQNWKVSVLLSATAPQHLQDYWFPRIMEDPIFVMSHTLSEPRGASDRWLGYNVPEAAMDTRATLENGYWVINGRKQFATNTSASKLYVVYACTNPDVGMQQGTSSFLVPRDTPGLTVGRAHEKLGCRFQNNAELIFEDCRVPEDHVLVRDTALRASGAYFDPAKIMQAAKCLGVGMGAYEETAAFCQSRVQGGRLLIQHQLVAAALAEMATKLEGVRAFTHWAARAVDEGASDASVVVKMAKIHATETVFQVCHRALELWGGMGIMRDAGIEKYFRDATTLLHPDGVNDILKLTITKALFPDTAGPYAGPVETPPQVPTAVG